MPEKTNLARTLRRLRESKKDLKGGVISLRKVSEETGISSAYLSQLESGDATNPSLDKLHALAKYYDIPYEVLMRAAGYIQPKSGTQDIGTFEAHLMSLKLKEEEKQQVLNFINHVLRGG